jgi:hypothetical protein
MCQLKKKIKGRGLVVKPIESSTFNLQCQVIILFIILINNFILINYSKYLFQIDLIKNKLDF